MKILISLAALASLAGTVHADLVVPSSNATGIEVSLGENLQVRGVPSGVYDSIPGPYAAFPAASGVLGADDYATIIGDSSFLMAQFRFVGGVTTAGTSIRVNFYDAAEDLANFFTVALPTGGSNSIWTINLGTAGIGSVDSTFSIPSVGFVEIVTVDQAAGRFWLTTTAPAVGTNDIAVLGVPGSHYHAFSMLQTPAPSALALMGIGGLFAARRRR